MCLCTFCVFRFFVFRPIYFAQLFLSSCRFGGRGRKNITGATPRQQERRARRGALLSNPIFETEHESQQEMSCRSRKRSGENGERRKEGDGRKAELGCLVSADVSREIRVEGNGCWLGGYLLISPRDRPRPKAVCRQKISSKLPLSLLLRFSQVKFVVSRDV